MDMIHDTGILQRFQQLSDKYQVRIQNFCYYYYCYYTTVEFKPPWHHRLRLNDPS